MNVATEATEYLRISSPIGEVLLLGRGEVLTGLYIADVDKCPAPPPDANEGSDLLDAVRRQVDDYFAGDRTDFDVKIDMVGTPFQRRVWQELIGIPYGHVISYRDLAARVGNPSAFRAVGNANGRNPICVIVPCHRVIAADGTLGGYGGGLDRKSWLLDLERKVAASS